MVPVVVGQERTRLYRAGEETEEERGNRERGDREKERGQREKEGGQRERGQREKERERETCTDRQS